MKWPHFINLVSIDKSMERIRRYQKYFDTWTYTQIYKKCILHKVFETCHIKERNIYTLLKIITNYSETKLYISNNILHNISPEFSSGFEDEHSKNHTNFSSSYHVYHRMQSSYVQRDFSFSVRAHSDGESDALPIESDWPILSLHGCAV
jgi:hypothetical protein